MIKFLLHFLFWFIGFPVLMFLIATAMIHAPLVCFVVIWFFLCIHWTFLYLKDEL